MSKKRKVIFVKRVSYGKKNVPKSKREYRPIKGGAVGTIDEWIKAGYTPIIEGRS